MAEYVFNEEGVPVLRPFSGRRKYGFMEAPASKDASGGTTASVAGAPTAVQRAPEVKLLSHIFDIDDRAFDVTLTSLKINWNVISGQKGGASAKVLQRKSSSSGGSGLKEGRHGTSGEVTIKDLFAVTVRYQKTSQSTGEGVCKGLELHTYEKRSPNKLRHKVVFLAHPSQDVCNTWRERASQLVQATPGRPKRIRLYLNPYAGEKRCRQDFKDDAMDLLRIANIQCDICELDKNTIQDDMPAQDLNSYDGLVAMGGDGTASEVINQLLICSQSASGVKADTSFTPVRALLPVAIFPCGTTNHICQSVTGIVDIQTSALHLVYGNRIAVDVCSISNKENFYRFGFNAHYGFGGNVLSYADRYRNLGSKRLVAAFLKALSKSKFRPYSVELSYVLSQSKNHPMDGVACRSSCAVCSSSGGGNEHGTAESVDQLQELDPLTLSSTSSTITDLSSDKSDSKILKGEYMNISVLAIPGNCDVAPEGLSKYGHLGDGCADIVLVKNVKKKDFVRHLKRFGNSKNQFDFPFVEVYRVKELRLNPRMPKGWQFRGDFNEITYEMKRREQQSGNANGSAHDIVEELGVSDGDNDDDDDNDNIASPATLGDDSSDDDLPQLGSDDGGRRAQSAGSGSRCGTPSGDSRSTGHVADGKEKAQGEGEPYVRMNYRALEREKAHARRKRKDEAKEKKDREKEEMRVRSVWNIDNTVVKSEIELSFRVHRQLVSLFGQGLSPDTPSEEAKVTCLPAIS